MAIDPRKRQKKLERRKAKDKAQAVAKRSQLQKLAAKAMEKLGSAPVLHCYITDDTWEEGMGQLLFSRRLPNNDVAFAMFLLDIYCLGVKNAHFDIFGAAEYEQRIIGDFKSKFSLMKLEPSCARKLIEGAVEYARSLGIPPHADYAKAQLILGDADASACDREFEFGKDGKPFYVAGPHDGMEKSKRIVTLLTNRCGEGNFDYVIPMRGPGAAQLPGAMPMLEDDLDDDLEDDLED